MSKSQEHGPSNSSNLEIRNLFWQLESPNLHEITEIAALTCQVPSAFISLVSQDKLLFKSTVNFETCETKKEGSFCAYAIEQNDEIFIVENAQEDERFYNSRFVVNDPYIKFYAAVPLEVAGKKIGTLSVIDTRPNKLTASQQECLKKLANQVLYYLNNLNQIRLLNNYSEMMVDIHKLNSKMSENFNLEHLEEYIRTGLNVLGLEVGILSQVEGLDYKVVVAKSPDDSISPNQHFELPSTYCEQVISKKKTITYSHVGSLPEMNKHPVYINMKLESYIGTPVYINDKVYGTLNYSSKEIRKDKFDDYEITFMEVLAQNISRALSIWESKTQRDKAYEILRDEKEKYRNILDLINEIPEYIGVFDYKSWKPLFLNKSLQKSSFSHEVARTELKEFYHPDDYQRMMDEAFTTISQEGVWKGELRFIDSKENEKLVFQTMTGQKDQSGELAYVSTIMHDISQIKELEGEVEKYQERMNQSIKAAKIGVWEWDTTGPKVYWDKTMFNLHGVTDIGNVIQYEEWVKLIHKDDRENFNTLMKCQFLRGEKISKEFRVIDQEGVRYLHIEGTVHQNTDDSPSKIIGTCWDLTEKHLHEIKLQESLERFRLLTELAPVGIFLTDKEGKATYVNKNWLEVAGMGPLDSLGDEWNKAIHQDDKERVLNEWNKAISQLAPFDLEFRFKNTHNKKVTFVKSTSRPLLDSSGQLSGYIGVNIDITRQKKTEEILVKTMREAQRTSNAKTMFLANMSHEIRTPLNSILGHADLLKETNLNADQKDYVLTLQHSSEALLHIINDILDLSKIESGGLELEKGRINFLESFDQISSIFKHRVYEKDIELYSYLSPEIGHIYTGDRTRVQQILMNLVGNAIKFTLEGHVLFYVQPNKTKKKGNVHIVVEDSGIGISEKNLKEIFTKFKQAQASTTKEFGGTGLGLSITKRLVHLMGGEIWVKSSPNLGSTFNVTLDLKAENTSLFNEHIRDGQRQDDALIISKKSLFSEVYRKSLDLLFKNITLLDSIPEAYKRLKSNKYNVILIDDTLFLDNNEKSLFFERIKKFNYDKIIFATKYEKKKPGKALKDIGIRLLKKPIKMTSLFNLIQIDKSKDKSPSVVSNDQLYDIDYQLKNRKIKILLVDDAPNNRNLIKAYLKKFPFSIHEESNGQSALDNLYEEEYDLILMDIQMPVLDGYSATKQFRKWEATQKKVKKTPVVALTAYALDEERKKSFKAGCDLHLSKPVSKKDLLEAILKMTSSA